MFIYAIKWVSVALKSRFFFLSIRVCFCLSSQSVMSFILQNDDDDYNDDDLYALVVIKVSEQRWRTKCHSWCGWAVVAKKRKKQVKLVTKLRICIFFSRFSFFIFRFKLLHKITRRILNDGSCIYLVNQKMFLLIFSKYLKTYLKKLSKRLN